MNVLFIIDVQNDFCEGGALACAGGKDIVPKINQLMEDRKFDLIIASQDWHPADHISFAENNGKKPFETLTYLPKVQKFNDGTIREIKGEIQQIMWPKHCVAGTRGASFYCEGDVLNTTKFNIIVRKGMNPQIDSYSAFGDNPVELQDGTLLKNSTGLHYLITNMLENRDAIDFYVTGIATDVCVKATVQDLLDLIEPGQDHRVTVLKDMCVGVTQEGHKKALEEMGGWGCLIENGGDDV